MKWYYWLFPPYALWKWFWMYHETAVGYSNYYPDEDEE